MSESVYERDGRRIREAIDALRAGSTSHAAIYDYSRSLVDVDLHRREVYSYGRHFPLFRYVPRDGRRRELFVINGDESPRSGRGWNGSRTPDHQSAVRSYVESIGAASLVIPFSALAGARIDIDSIRPIHVRPDTTWQETITRAPADTPVWHKRGAYLPASGMYEERAPDADGMYRWLETHHRLGDCLFSAVRIGETARRRYLSSFDYEERTPLYFLVQVPRGAGETVETAIDSLAPRAVWAARARGLEVRRQGDIFFVETRLADVDLEARGIRARVRLTQLDRDARARTGELGYVAPLDANARRRMAAFTHAEFLRITRDARTQLEYREAPRAGPKTDKGARAKWAKVRAADERDLERARAELRRATLGSRTRGYYVSGYDRYSPVNRYDRMSPLQRERYSILSRVRRARESLETVEARAARNRYGRAAARDSYRAPFTAGPAAIVAMRMARVAAGAKFYPDRYGAGAEERRAKVRRALSIYGTAHTAREVITCTGGAVFVRGKVSHRPELDAGRPSWDRAPDHRPIELDPSVWYLAIRNTVPRARA